MSFDHANEGRANPNWGKSGYMNNCGACVVAFKLRLDGWDVVADACTNGSKVKEITEEDKLTKIWQHKSSNKIAEWGTLVAHSKSYMYRSLYNMIKSGEIYQIFYDLIVDNCSHTIVVGKRDDGVFYYYDPQQFLNNKGRLTYTTERGAILDKGFNLVRFGGYTEIKFIRIDDKVLNPDYVSVVRRAGA